MSKEPTKAPQKGGLPLPKMNRGLKGFYRDVLREMKHVNWPTPAESTRMTGVVLAVCTSLILVLYGLSELMAFVMHQITGGR